LRRIGIRGRNRGGRFWRRGKWRGGWGVKVVVLSVFRRENWERRGRKGKSNYR